MTTRVDVRAELDQFDRLIAQTDGVDRFCSSSIWSLSAYEAFHADHVCHSWAESDHAGAFLGSEIPRVGPYLMPLESVWGLACPIAGPDPRLAARAALERLNELGVGWNIALIAGVVVNSRLVAAIVQEFGGRHGLRATPPVSRHIASLAGGVDEFLGRRTRKFRANLRRVVRTGEGAGLTYERMSLRTVVDVDLVFPRILAVEQQSWKTRVGAGVAEGPMRDFNHGVLRRASACGDARVVFARLDGLDVGYIHGAVVGDYFRGLQVSFDNRHRALGIGNGLQWEMINWLCSDGVQRYDLGTELPYKRRWAEEELVTSSIIVTR